MASTSRLFCAERLGAFLAEQGLRTTVGEQTTKRYCHVIFQDKNYLYKPDEPEDLSLVYGMIQVLSGNRFVVASNQHGTVDLSSEEEVKKYLIRHWGNQ